jgi:hypothetical protein
LCSRVIKTLKNFSFHPELFFWFRCGSRQEFSKQCFPSCCKQNVNIGFCAVFHLVLPSCSDPAGISKQAKLKMHNILWYLLQKEHYSIKTTLSEDYCFLVSDNVQSCGQTPPKKSWYLSTKINGVRCMNVKIILKIKRNAKQLIRNFAVNKLRVGSWNTGKERKVFDCYFMNQ